jgi:hypothetical protein
MSMRQSPSDSNPNPSNMPGPPVKTPASGSEGRKPGAQAEDGRFQPAADLRFPIVDLRRATPLWRLSNTLINVRNGALSRKDVKNEDRSDYVHENKGKATKCTPLKSGFLHKNAPIERQLTKICRAYWQKMRRLRDKKVTPAKSLSPVGNAILLMSGSFRPFRWGNVPGEYSNRRSTQNSKIRKSPGCRASP